MLYIKRDYVIAVTGHRPKDLLGGNDVESEHNDAIYDEMLELLIQKMKDNSESRIVCNSGGQLGIDRIFEDAVLDLQESYGEERFILNIIVPFTEDIFTRSFSDFDYYHFKSNVELCNHYEELSNEYNSVYFKERNEKLLDSFGGADCLLAYFNGRYKSGTYSCINSAKKRGIDIYYKNTGLK